MLHSVFPVSPPLDGLTSCFYTPATDSYQYPFRVSWQYPQRYGWIARLNNKVNNILDDEDKSDIARLGVSNDQSTPDTAYDKDGVNLSLIQDSNNRFSDRLPSDLEVGWAVWLGATPANLRTQEKHWSDHDDSDDGCGVSGAGAAPANETPADHSECWATRAMVGTRVSSAPHTSCCYQFMRSLNKGNAFANEPGGFVLTEYCFQADMVYKPDRANAQNSGSRDWYVGSTLHDIERGIRAVCGDVERATKTRSMKSSEPVIEFSEEFLDSSLPDNKTASELWDRLLRDGETLSERRTEPLDWTTADGAWRITIAKPWVEIYPYGYHSSEDGGTALLESLRSSRQLFPSSKPRRPIEIDTTVGPMSNRQPIGMPAVGSTMTLFMAVPVLLIVLCKMRLVHRAEQTPLAEGPTQQKIPLLRSQDGHLQP